jgi:hypothetical protein
MTSTILLMILNCCIQSAALAPAGSKPLPELDSFLKDIRKHLHSDQILQSQYTYAEKTILRELDSGGRVKRTETRAYEVYPSLEERMTYRKLISKNDKPLSAEEISKSDNNFEKKRREWERKMDRESTTEKQRREKEALQKEEESLDEAFRLYRISMIGREEFEGLPAIVLRFDPRPEYKPRTRDGKILAKIQGKAWFSEADQELVRIEAELLSNLSFGLGFIARLNKGMRVVFQRSRVNDEVWLPASAHFSGTGRLLVFKGFRIDQEMVYSDYRKFSIESGFKISGPGNSAKRSSQNPDF